MKCIAPSTLVARRWEENGEQLVDWVPEFAQSSRLGHAYIADSWSCDCVMLFVIRRDDGVTVEVDEVGMAAGIAGRDRNMGYMIGRLSSADFAREVRRSGPDIAHRILDAYHVGNPFRAEVTATPYGDIE